MKDKDFESTPNYKRMVEAIDDNYRNDPGQAIADPMERLRFYAQQAQNTDAERKVIEVRIRAERGVRRLLREELRSSGELLK